MSIFNRAKNIGKKNEEPLTKKSSEARPEVIKDDEQYKITGFFETINFGKFGDDQTREHIGKAEKRSYEVYDKKSNVKYVMDMVRSDNGYNDFERNDINFPIKHPPVMVITLTVSYGEQKKEYAAYSNTSALSEYGMESNMLNELKTKRQKASARGRSQSEIDEENRGKDLMLALITLVDDKILEAPRLAEKARIEAKEDRYKKNAEQDAARKAADEKKAKAQQHFNESFNNLMNGMKISRR